MSRPKPESVWCQVDLDGHVLNVSLTADHGFTPGYLVCEYLAEPVGRQRTLTEVVTELRKHKEMETAVDIVLAMNPESTFRHAQVDAYQDYCENCPFASVGGLDKRADPKAPSYVPEDDKEEYVRGYISAVKEMYGDDWRTCEFSWQPALTIGGKEEK